MFNKYIFVILFILFSFNIYASDLKLAVAANVSYSIDDLIEEFKKENQNIKIKTIIGSSGKLTAKIVNGVSYDIFLSANMTYPQILFDKNLTLTKPYIYAKGGLALFSKKQQDFSNALEILKDKKIKRIAIANPKIAPYGIAAFEALKNAQIMEDIKKKFVYGESISQTVSYSLTAANIGIIAKSTLYSSKMSKFKENINWIEIDKNLYKPINQGIVVIKNKKKNNHDLALKFFEFMKSKKAKKILEKYGYQVDYE